MRHRDDKAANSPIKNASPRQMSRRMKETRSMREKFQTKGASVMRETLSALLTLALLFALAPVKASYASADARKDAAEAGEKATRADVDATEKLSGLPLSFTPNAGQMDASVKYQMRASGGTVFFKESEVVYALPAPRGVVRRKGDPPTLDSIDLRVRFEGANAGASIEGRNALPGKASYFIGSDPTRWRASLPTYSRLSYAKLYEGIELEYDGANGRLKSTYTVAPNADPARIRWTYAGATGLRVDAESGDLIVALPTNTAQRAEALKTKAGAKKDVKGSASGGSSEGAKDAPQFVERAPLAWQDVEGRRVPVSARYEIAEDGTVGFALGNYDRTRPLVIDPDIEWSYYVGGAGNDYGYSVALDASGDIYVAGVTSSPNFPVSVPPGAQGAFGGKIDVFVVKLNSTGDTILYSTFLGGDEDDCAFGLALDAAGNAHVAGYTRSANFPTANAFQNSYGGGHSDAFAAKISTDGRALLYSTYIGGADEDVARAIALASGSQAALTGYTRSANFPTVSALQSSNAGAEDAFVLRLNAGGGALLHSTYLGGAGADYGEAIAVDRFGAAHVAGSTESANFPVHQAEQSAKKAFDDAFAAKLAPSGDALTFSTYLGGDDSDFARTVSLDRWGNMYVAGFTRSLNFPTLNPFQPSNAGGDDAFLARLKPNGKLRYSTYFGGNGDDNAFGLAVDREGYATLAGRTRSANFPVQNSPAGGARGSDGNDAFVARFTSGGQGLIFSAYLGGNGHEIAEAVALDSAGNAYVTGYTYSDEGFPKPPTDPHRGLLDEEMFILKIAEPTPSVAACTSAINVALASDNAVASASSTYPIRFYSPAGANDGDRKGTNWETGGGWNDATRDAYPDWLEITFDDVKTLSEIRVYTLQNDFHNPQEPTPDTPADIYGVKDFDVQYWDGDSWETVLNGSVAGNARAMRSFAFAPLTTNAIRVFVRDARAHFSRIVELEAFGCNAQ